MSGPVNPTSEKVIVVCDPARADADMTALLIALEREGKLEIIHCESAESGSPREDEIKELLKAVQATTFEKPLPAPSSLPYWRQFERKRRAR